MSTQRYREYPMTVAAGAEHAIEAMGSFLACLVSSGSFRIRIDDGPAVFFDAGLMFSVAGEDFRKVSIVNSGLVSVSCTLAIGQGRLEDRRLINSAPVEIAGHASLDTVPDVAVPAGAATLIAAALATRHGIIVSVPQGATAPVRIGDSNVGAARGIEVYPGDRVSLTTQAAVYGYSASAVSIGVVTLS